jgi:hypothetical protein
MELTKVKKRGKEVVDGSAHVQVAGDRGRHG